MVALGGAHHSEGEGSRFATKKKTPPFLSKAELRSTGAKKKKWRRRVIGLPPQVIGTSIKVFLFFLLPLSPGKLELL